MLPVSSYADFESASNEVMSYLQSHMGFDLWMVTRVESDDWIVLNAMDESYNVSAGNVFRWTDSFCSRMVEGKGPQIAACSRDIPAYVEAPIGKQMPIGAYVGVPLTRSSGEMFGTLCAMNPDPMPAEIADELPLVQMMARLLTTILENELRAEVEHRRAERAMTEAITDGLTGLYNRRGWEELLAKECERCRRYGHPACVFSIDLDGLKEANDEHGHAEGDKLICRAADALAGVANDLSISARLGGDEFALLAVQCDPFNATIILRQIEAVFREAGVEASVGMAFGCPSETLADTFEKADHEMYVEKRRRKSDGQNAVTC